MNYFLLCAYNEEKNIGDVISSIRETFYTENYTIVIVNDGSTDATQEVVCKLREEKEDIILLNHKKNLGLGCALRTGFDFLFSKVSNEDIIITLDADNTHPLEISNFIVSNLKQKADIVIASRYQKNSVQQGVPFFRKILSFLGRVTLTIFFPYHGVSDYTSGYRWYRGELIKKAKNFYGENFITEQSFVVQVEILYKLFYFKPKIIEVPLILQYNKKYGKSKLKIVKNIIKYLQFILRYI